MTSLLVSGQNENLCEVKTEEQWSDNLFICEVCHGYFKGLDQLEYHLKSQHDGVAGSKCSTCGCVFVNQARLDEHQKKLHASCFYCHACQKAKYRNKEDFDKHVESCIQERKYLCNECPRAYENRAALRYHMSLKKHVGMVCRVCNQKFFDHKEYFLHMDKEENKSLVCPYCGKEFTRDTYLRVHIWGTHQENYKKLCDICGWTTNRPDSMSRHLILHKEGGKICDLCGFECLNNSERRKHMVAHNPYVCTKCNHFFLGITLLRKHYKKCKEQSENESEHAYSMEELDEVKPEDRVFNCHACGKRVKASHAMAHLDFNVECSRKHRCLYCSQLFKTTEALKSHEENHEGPFICSYCKRGYIDWNKCSEHVKEHIEKRKQSSKTQIYRNKVFIKDDLLSSQEQAGEMLEKNVTDNETNGELSEQDVGALPERDVNENVGELPEQDFAEDENFGELMEPETEHSTNSKRNVKELLEADCANYENVGELPETNVLNKNNV